MNGAIRRGQPLAALALILTGWIGARIAIIHWPEQQMQPQGEFAGPSATRELAGPAEEASAPNGSSVGQLVTQHQALPQPPTAFAPTPLPVGPLPPALNASPIPQPISTPAPQPVFAASRIAGGHQMLWLAALAQLPMAATSAAPQPVALPNRGSRRWSVDGWLMLRPSSLASGAAMAQPGASYGNSQAGAVIRYHLAPGNALRPMLYLRATRALIRPNDAELAGGLGLHPLPRVPVVAMAELRVTHASGKALVRPAVALVSEIPPIQLPLRLRGEAYVQAGIVGGSGSTAFVDGQWRLERQIARSDTAELRLGGGAWGGAQRGASRLDIGPGATLSLRFGEASARMSADWRFRVAGNAAPASGPTLTLAAGF